MVCEAGTRSGHDVYDQNRAQRNTNVVVRSMAYLGGAGAHACESGRTEQRPSAKWPTYTKARNPDSMLQGAPGCEQGSHVRLAGTDRVLFLAICKALEALFLSSMRVWSILTSRTPHVLKTDGSGNIAPAYKRSRLPQSLSALSVSTRT
jgi:hypothetical protein